MSRLSRALGARPRREVREERAARREETQALRDSLKGSGYSESETEEIITSTLGREAREANRSSGARFVAQESLGLMLLGAKTSRVKATAADYGNEIAAGAGVVATVASAIPVVGWIIGAGVAVAGAAIAAEGAVERKKKEERDRKRYLAEVRLDVAAGRISPTEGSERWVNAGGSAEEGQQMLDAAAAGRAPRLDSGAGAGAGGAPGGRLSGGAVVVLVVLGLLLTR